MPDVFAECSPELRAKFGFPNPNPNPNEQRLSLKRPLGTPTTTTPDDEGGTGGIKGTRDRALRAIDAKDWEALAATGWIKVFDLLRYGWPPPRGGKANRIDPVEARAWVTVLGDQPIDAIVAALDDWTASGRTMRPFPAQLRDLIPAGDKTATTTRLAAARQAASAGAEPCDCPVPDLRFRTDNTVRCLECAGIERDLHNQATEGSQP